jgi:SPP1 gp7 family putative phage head morphogenesis protein
MNAKQLAALVKIAKMRGANGLSDADQRRLYAEAGGDGFARICDDILADDPGIAAMYKEMMKDWKVSDKSALNPYDQFKFSSQTAWFRSVTKDNLSQMQAAGVQSVQIVAYLDDRTSEICRQMHGRIFPIEGYTDSQMQNQLTPPAEQMHASYGKPTSEIGTMLPPYHYNCRTTFVPFSSPDNLQDEVKNTLYNNEQIDRKQAEELLKQAAMAKWSNSARMRDHAQRHGREELGLSMSGYNNLMMDNIKKAGRDLIFVIDGSSQNLQLWSSRYSRTSAGDDYYLLSLVDVSNGNLITCFELKEKKLDKMLQKALRSSKVYKGSSIMKSDEKVFEWGDVPEDIGKAISIYRDFFFSMLYEQIEVQLDMQNRYGLHLAEMQGLLSDEQLETITELDKKYIMNYRKGKYKSDYWLQIDEMAEFFDWLSGQIEE